ncbi:MAG: hypothetical protein MI922_10730, partial [Bacteroidales bacterium]|nr:hypothetical protein [Bacteroidales bacterium]
MMPNKHFLKSLLCGIICFITVAQSFALQDKNNSWELAKEADGVEVYVRTIDNSTVTEFKASITVKATMAKMVDAIHNLSDYHEWMSSCLEANVLK